MKQTLPNVLIGFVILTLLACGGGGAFVGQPSINLSASDLTIEYGEPVRISWSSTDVAAISDANFAVSPGDVNGSLTDYPATDTTYQIEGKSSGGDSASDTITVKVNPGPKRILLVADPAGASTSAVAQFLQRLSTQVVEVSQTLPATTLADVLVIGQSATITDSDKVKVVSFLAAGKGVILSKRGPCLLATGDIDNNDISAVGSWFAGATTCSGDLGVQTVPASAPSGFPLSTVFFGDRIDQAVQVSPVSSQALLRSGSATGGHQAFAYVPALGGRVGYVAGIPIDSGSDGTTMRELFLAIVRWASKELP